MPDLQDEESCDIPSLASDNDQVGLKEFDQTDTLAATVYMIALTIKSLGGGAPDYTDICALAKSLQQYDGLPDYARNAARLQAWEEISENTTGQEVDWAALKEAIKCAHCCDITKASLESAMTVLLCRLAQLLQNV